MPLLIFSLPPVCVPVTRVKTGAPRFYEYPVLAPFPAWLFYVRPEMQSEDDAV